MSTIDIGPMKVTRLTADGPGYVVTREGDKDWSVYSRYEGPAMLVAFALSRVTINDWIRARMDLIRFYDAQAGEAA